MTLTDIVIEIKDLLGLTDVEVPEETDILRGGQTLLRPLHQLIIGLCLASHFNNHRYFINGMDDIKLENEKLRVIIESLNGETQCHIHDALNILTYSTLEQLEYPRISKITLDEIQEPRELFLAFLFLISKQQWFDRLEKRCPIQWKFTNCIINSIVQELNDLNRQKYAEMIDNDALLEQLQSLWDNQNIGYDDKISFDTPSASNATLRQRKFACGMSYLHSKSLTPIVLKETKQHVPCDTMDNELSNFSAKVSKCMSSIRNAKSQQTWRHPLQNKGSCIEAKDCAAHKNSLLDDISKIISHTAKDLKAKAELFCRSKDAETFDSELLRIIIGQSQDQNIFNHLMDDIEQVVLNVDLQEKGKVANMVQHNRKSAANRKGVLNVDCNNSNSQINVVLTEIGQLSNFIVQMQSRLKRLAQSVEQGDIERLKSFTRLSENQKDYDKQAHKKLYEQVKTSHSSNIHTLGKPTPAEWVLICRKESFERHLSLLRMIKKSLENEIKRTYLFESGLKMVQMFNPDSTARTPTSNVHSARGSIALVIVPKKIKENVNMLKSFIVEGIATDNFVEEEELKDNSAKRCAMDFLRQTNSNFSKYRSSLTASKSKKSFHSFLSSILNQAELEKGFSKVNNNKTKSVIKNMLHLFDEADKYDPNIYFASLSAWIQLEEPPVIPVNVMGSPSHAKRNGPIPLDIDELELFDYIQMSNLVNEGEIREAPPHVPQTNIGISPVANDGIFDFAYYFKLAQIECSFRQSKEIMKMEPTFMALEQQIKEHDNSLAKLESALFAKGEEHRKNIGNQLSNIAFIE